MTTPRTHISGRRIRPKGGFEYAGSDGQGDGLVADGPTEVLSHLAQRAAADGQGGGHVERIGAHVQSPAYRDDKRGTTLQMLPELFSGERGPQLVVRIDDGVTIEAPKAVLVSNNPYELGDLAGLGRRARLDTGTLGVIAVTVDSVAQAVELLRGRGASGIRRLLAHEVVIDADADEIPVGLDGEAVMMTTPVRCAIRPLALRVRVPRDRPGVPAPAPRMDRTLLLRQALTMPHHAHAGKRSDGQRPRQ